MQITPEYLDSIKPKTRRESDKYSWNIYRYLKEHQSAKIAICWYGRNSMNGLLEKLDKEKSLASGQSFILINGIDENLCGIRISDLQRRGNHSALKTFSFCLYNQDNFTDITEWFLTNYQRIGRCIFDLNHSGWWSGDDNRFTNINKKSRRCNWCGEHHRKKIVKEINIKRRSVWS